MQGRTFRNLVHKLLRAGQGVAVVASAIVSATVVANPTQIQKHWAILLPLLQFLQDWGWCLLLFFSLYLALAEFLRGVIGQPWVWSAIQQHLDLFQQYAFADVIDSQLHYHRVTLFKHVGWRTCWRKWPWSGWLIPVARSGHTTQKTDVAFKAPDNAEEAEGVAGVTWARGGVLIVKELPSMEGSPSEADIEEYAHKTWVSKKWVINRLGKRSFARSFIGIPVEVNGKRWGVVVLDSRDEIHSGANYRNLYKLISKLLAILLERVEK